MGAMKPFKRNHTARELAERLGVSERTVQRLMAQPRDEYLAETHGRQDEALRLRELGMKWREVGEALGGDQRLGGLPARCESKGPACRERRRVSAEPVLSLAEAARACGLSVSTVRRRLPRLTEHGATRHDTSWRIPISALVAEGLMPRVTPPDTPSRDTLTRSTTRHDETPSDASSERLRVQLAEAEKRAAVAEAELRGARALVDEKQRAIDAQAHTLRLLEPPRTATLATEQPDTERPGSPQTPWVTPVDETPQMSRPNQNQSASPQVKTEPARRTWWVRLWNR